MKHQVLWFLLVGTTGFIVDAGGVWTLTSLAEWSPIWARVPSLAIALMITFTLNRTFTFKAQHKPLLRSFVAYLSANAISQGFNFALYTTLVLMSARLYQQPVMALAISSIAAMSLSFVLSKYWVFKSHEN